MEQHGPLFFTLMPNGRTVALDRVAKELLIRHTLSPPEYTPAHLTRMVKQYGVLAGVGDFVTPTALRYTWAVRAMCNRMPDSFIMNQMGIADRHILANIRRRFRIVRPDLYRVWAVEMKIPNRAPRYVPN
jgi:hypothetical protein